MGASNEGFMTTRLGMPDWLTQITADIARPGEPDLTCISPYPETGFSFGDK